MAVCAIKPVLLGVAISIASTLAAHGQALSPTNIDLSIFSTYPSELAVSRCEEAVASDICKEDTIPPDVFAAQLSETSWFSRVAPFSEGQDYELLVAHLSGPQALPTQQQEQQEQHFAEITLLWRGMEIDSTIIEETFAPTLNNDTKALSVLTRWYQYSQQHALFSASFLYTSLNASNYLDELVIPTTLGDFSRLDTQLYPDPFKGVITRYTHPTFEDALVDVTVYPILGQVHSDNEKVLVEQLESDWVKAEAVAEHQALTLSKETPATRYSKDNDHSVWRLGIKAESPTQDTIYATTYVFQRQDKIVKIATTFPTTMSDPIADALIAQISVPKESSLMAEVRELLK